MKKTLESVLRPPVEWASSIVLIILAIMIVVIQPTWLLIPNLNDYLALALGVLAFLRFYQGWQVFKYQRNLKRLPFYAMSSSELPISKTKLFLGKGFQWEAKHTQRLRDLKQSGREKYLNPGKLYRLARQIEFNTEYSKKFAWLHKGLASQSKFNFVKSLPPVGGNPAIHGIEPNEQDIFMNLSERVGHTMILGTTRVGKTRLLELLIASDIRRNDSAVIVLDPKGDVDLLRRIIFEAKTAGRENDVIIFHLGYPTVSARYNPVGNFARITEVANRVANQLPSSGESAAFKEFAWRFVNIIAGALVALGRKPNYQDLEHYILNIDPLLQDYCGTFLATRDPNWRDHIKQQASLIDVKKLPMHLRTRSPFMIALVRYVDSLKQDDPIYDGLKSIFNYDQTYFQKITASLSPLFAKLTSGRIAELISPDYSNIDDTRPIFDWMQVIRGKKIVYVGLDALSDATVSSAVGNSMFADLCSTVGQIYKFGVENNIADINKAKTFHKVNVYSDEFNELAGDEFIPLANKGGGAGLQLTVATQTGSDVVARIGNQAKANQIFGNFNSLICLRVLEEATAKLLTSKLPQYIQIKDIVHASSTHDTGLDDKAFTSQAEDRIVTLDMPLIATDDVMQLPKGQAFCLLNGGKLYKCRFPLPKQDMAALSDDVETLVQTLSNKKSSNEDE